MSRVGICSSAVWLACGCGPTGGLPSNGATGGTTKSSQSDAGSSGDPQPDPAGTDDDSTSAASSGSTTEVAGNVTGSPDTTDGSTGTSGERCAPLACGNATYDCGDGIDNDRDGLIDLQDPSCSSPCDDSEDSFSNAIPGMNDCKLDCAFDGNYGHGDGGCMSDLRCDPFSPGETVGCAHDDSPACTNQPFGAPQLPQCLAFCEPLTVPGCDCFGCCTLQSTEGPIDIHTISAPPECTAEAPENCPRCTSQIEQCGNPCDGCEICFGETEPAAGCAEVECSHGPPCGDSCDCPDGGYCLFGCCHPAPPG